MRKLNLKLLCIIAIVLCLILSFPMNANGYNYYTYNNYSAFSDVRLLKNNDEIFLVAKNKNEIRIEAVYPDKYNIELTFDYDVYSYNLFESTLVATCPEQSTKQTTVYLYDINSDYFTSFAISNANNIQFSQICYCNPYIYISDDNGLVYKYSSYGKLIKTFDIHHDTVHLGYNLSNEVYAFTNNGVFKIGDSALEIYRGNIDTPVQFVSNKLFVDDSGYYYEIIQNKVVKLTNFKSSVYYPSGCSINNHIFITDNNTIYAVDKDTNKTDKCIQLPTFIEELHTIDSTIIALTYENGCPVVSVIEYESMLTCKRDNNSNSEINNSTSNNANNDTTINSKVYTIDNKRQVILDIPYGTTVGEFKRNMSYEGFDIQFTRYDGKIIKSGNVGTATIVRFYNDDYFVEYELSVTGDLTGEGNVNSRDKEMLFSYLLDEVSFTGVFLDSADIHKTDRIDVADMVLLLRLIEEQK